MATNPSYANGNILRGLNLIGFSLPTSTYQTAYYDVSSFSKFFVSASCDTLGLTVSVLESVDASGNPSSERVITVGSIGVINILEDLGSFSTKSRFLSLQLSGVPGSLINTQFLFR